MRASSGAVFSARDFLDLGNRAAIDQALFRVARDGKVRRIGRGLYDIPRKGTIVDARAPSPDAVAAAIARKFGARVAPTGAQAANAFGLTTQVPAQARYLTDHPAKAVRIGKQVIAFDQVVPKRLARHPISTAVIESLRHIGHDHVTGDDVARIRRSLSRTDRQALRADLQHAPTWMHRMIQAIASDDDHANDSVVKRHR